MDEPELTIKDLADMYGISENAIHVLIGRGVLPKGRIENRRRLLPAVECLEVMGAHKPGEHWVKGRARPGKRKANKVEQVMTWEDAI